jgi:serine protease
VLVVAASGNAYGPVYCPAAINDVIAVGSTNKYDTRPSYSNYGVELDIAAPGGEFGDVEDDQIYSSLPGNGSDGKGEYGGKYGTSMAAPYVSGLAALVWSVSPSLTKDQVMDIIQDNADDLYPSPTDNCGISYPSYVSTPGWDPCFGHGRINAWDTLQALSFQSSPSQLTLMVDDIQEEASGVVQVTTLNSDVITWTATISPSVSWLNISSSDSGTISASSSPNDVMLLATSDLITYTDTPTTITLVITGTTASGANVATSSDIQLIYQSELYRYYFPLIFKN